MFFKSGDPHPYCKNACEPRTMCGEVKVPEEHLEVCRVCNAFGQNCKVLIGLFSFLSCWASCAVHTCLLHLSISPR